MERSKRIQSSGPSTGCGFPPQNPQDQRKVNEKEALKKKRKWTWHAFGSVFLCESGQPCLTE